MATTLNTLHTRTTLAGTADQNFDLATSITGVSTQYWAQFWPTTGGTKIPVQNVFQNVASVPTSPSGLSYDWISPRLSADVTLTGTTVTVAHTGRLFSTYDAAKATLRFELSKITSSGNVETLLGTLNETAVASSETSETAVFSTSMTITPMTLAAGERFVLRAFLIPAPGQTMVAQSTALKLGFGGGTGTTLTLTFTDTMTFLSNTTRLYQRRTTTIGIGTFQDLLTTKVTQTGQTATVNTDVGGGATQLKQGSNAVTVAATATSLVADTSNLSTYTSGSVTPAANALHIVGVVHSDAAPEATHPTITTTTGLNFVELTSVPFATIASNAQRLTVFRALKTTGLSTGTITINFADASTGCLAQLYSFSGSIDTSGTDGANAVRNVVTNSADNAADPSVTFGTFAQGFNGAFAVFGYATALSSAPSPWVAIGSNSIATPTSLIQGAWKQGAESSLTMTAAAQAWAAVGLEIALTTPAAGTPLEWISPRLSTSWWFDNPDSSAMAVGIRQAMGQVNTSVNAALMLRLYRWRAGVETQVFEYVHNAELAGAPSDTLYAVVAGQTVVPTGFQPDDRVVVRILASPVGTLGGGYVSLVYDAGSATFPTALIDLFDLPVNPFKLETDAATPATIPDSMMTLGLQN